MAFDLASISRGAVIKAPRIILLGVEKIGKSTFASKANRPIFIQVNGEEGIDQIDVDKFPPAESFQDVLQCFETLSKHADNFETIVIDSASALEPIIWKRVCERNKNAESIEKVGGGYAKGYTEALMEWRTITQFLDEMRNKANIASIIVGHVKVKRFDDPTTSDSYDQYQFDINDRAANMLYRWADAILFCNTKVVVKKGEKEFGKSVGNRGQEVYDGERFLYTQKRPSHPGGGRGVFGHLPYELPLDWGCYQNAIAEAISTQK